MQVEYSLQAANFAQSNASVGAYDDSAGTSHLGCEFCSIVLLFCTNKYLHIHDQCCHDKQDLWRKTPFFIHLSCL